MPRVELFIGSNRSNQSILFNTLVDSECRNTSFSYYKKNYFSGNHYTGGELPETTQSCVGEHNSLTEVSSLYGAYIIGEEIYDITGGQSISPEAIILNSTGLIQDAAIVWKVRYDKDGEIFPLDQTWEEYQPTVTFTEKESYELYIYSINGDTDIIGHRTLRVHVE